MKRTLTFLLLFMKRLCKKPSFLVILLLMPVLVLGFRLILSEDDETMYVALFNESGNKKIDTVIDELVAGESTMCFYEAESTEDLRAAVLTEHAECGFVFEEGLWEAMVKEEAEGLITVYQNTKTTNSDLIKERIFSQMYRYLSYDVMLNHMENSEFEDGLTTEAREAYLFEKYEQYITDGGVFTISYMEGDNTVVKDIEDAVADNSYLLKPVRGVLAVFMFMAAMAGAVFWAIDEKAGVYKTLGYTERPFVNMVVIFLPAFMSCMVALISVFIGGVAEGIFLEIVRILAYCIMLTGFANLIRACTSNATLICSLLPMLTVVSVICCHIIVNVVHYVPGVKYVRILLPPNYYLETSKGFAGCFITAGIGLVLICAGVLIDRKKCR